MLVSLAAHDGRVVAIGQFVLFSTGTGDAWLLNPSDRFAAPLARDGDPEPVDIKDRLSSSPIAAVAGVLTIFGYPINLLPNNHPPEISMFLARNFAVSEEIVDAHGFKHAIDRPHRR